jgi:CobQ-like glutamine amidotransferase family enzyme
VKIVYGDIGNMEIYTYECHMAGITVENTIRYLVEVAEYFPASHCAILCLTVIINDAVMKSLCDGIIVSN